MIAQTHSFKPKKIGCNVFPGLIISTIKQFLVCVVPNSRITLSEVYTTMKSDKKYLKVLLFRCIT